VDAADTVTSSPAAATGSSGSAARRVRHALVGDVGGHATALFDELVRLGADPSSGRLPDDLHVVQVGDLVHRGPDSDQVVALVDRYLTQQPDQWTQLVGNHEMQYLRDPVFEWPERLHARAVDTLRRWWAEGLMAVAAAVPSAGGAHLVTHAGVTADFWELVLDGAPSAEQATAALNALAQGGCDELVRAGEMLHGARQEGPVGPLWASASTELLPSWLGRALPFSQVHGHSSLYDWDRGAFRSTAAVAALTTVDQAARHETSSLAGGRIVGVDPCHGRVPAQAWRSWET
jgi:hypothetical protein